MTRTAHPTRTRDARWEERVLCVLMIVVGAIRVGIAIGARERFGGEASLAAIMLGLGVLLLFWRR
jgi:hypothetical protein